MNQNACAFCKKRKRKCNKARPSCSNCVRLRRDCVYTEDAIQTNFAVDTGSSRPSPELPDPHLAASSAGSVDLFNQETLQQSVAGIAMQIIGSVDNMRHVANDFFTGTHQRIPALSRFRFYGYLESLATGPRPDFAALCLTILLIEQMPSGRSVNVKSPLYLTVRNLISSLEASTTLTLDLAHCRILVAFYEMGHGLHTAAYISVAACARTARVLGLHRKTWRDVNTSFNKMILEEEKRTWWAIVNMDRFIGLCNGDDRFATDDPERADSLPIQDLLWSEGSVADIEGFISAAPTLETSFNVTVGQMARECQISHLAGRVVRHVFDPTPDSGFNAEEAIQLERTLLSYLPLLADEELRIGKYCGAFGVCNSALFTLYEFMLSKIPDNIEERNRIFRSIEETALRVITFAEASYGDREENYPPEIRSPYLPYSLCQAAIIQYQLWKHTGDPIWKQRLDSLKIMIEEFSNRWMVAWKYLEIIDNLNETWSQMAVPFQGAFISTGKLRI